MSIPVQLVRLGYQQQHMSRKVPCTHVFKVLREDRMNYSPSHLENVGRDIVQNGHDVLYQVELCLVPKHVLHAQGRRETHTIMSHTRTQRERKGSYNHVTATCTGERKGRYKQILCAQREEERVTVTLKLVGVLETG